MKRNTLLIALALFAGGVIALAIRAGNADSPAPEATWSISLPDEAGCGAEITGNVYLNELPERISRQGVSVALGAYEVTVKYPREAFELPAERPQVAELPVLATDGSAATRTFIASPGYRDEANGTDSFGAFSSVGAPNESRTIEGIDATDDVKAREEAGLAPGAEPIFLGSFGLIARSPGKPTVDISIMLLDSSIDVLEYEADSIQQTVEITGSDCPAFMPAPTPTATETSLQVPPLTDYNAIPTPRPYPNEVSPDSALQNLPDVCATGARVTTLAIPVALCLPAGWAVTEDPGPEAGAVPKPGKRHVVVRLSKGDLATIGIYLSGPDPYSITGCSKPAEIVAGRMCVHEENGDSDSLLMRGTWRFVGITTSEKRHVVIAVNDMGDLVAQQEAQKEGIAIVSALVAEGWK